MEITELLAYTKRNNASDLHISSGHPPILRVDGDLMPLKMDKLTSEQVQDLIYSVMTESQRAKYENDYELDFAVQFGPQLRFRANAYQVQSGPAIAFRCISERVPTLDELNMPPILKRLASRNKGLVLITGPTGSGKSTTLAAMIDYINENYPKHIITIEDPVEYIHKSKRCLVNQRELGSDTHSFAKALKSALREDPDVILVEEMRDLETIHLALTAAETGHLVLGTLHTSSAAKTVDRIVDVFDGNEKELVRSMLSSSIEAIITQTLLKKSGGEGRVAALEIMVGTPAIRNLVREGKTPQIYSLMQVGKNMGMQTMKDAITGLLQDGKVKEESAKSALNMMNDEMIGEANQLAGTKANANQQGGWRSISEEDVLSNSNDF